MASWFSKLTPGGQWRAAVDNIEAALEVIGLQWLQLEHESKIAAGTFMMESIEQAIPGYDFARNFHAQFFAFIHKMPVELRE